MPNNITPQNDVAGMCNPTHSTAVNKLLEAVIMKEAAHVGHPSQARRASEYVKVPICIFCTHFFVLLSPKSNTLTY